MNSAKDTLCPSKWGDSEIGTTRCRYRKGHSGKHATIDAPEGQGVTWTDQESDEHQDALRAQSRALQGFDHTATPSNPTLQRTNATEASASGWSEREEVVQSVLLQCAENGIPITRHAVRIILEQISQNREALDFLARH